MSCDGAAVRTGRCEAPAYRFAKVDVDAEPALAGRYGVRSIPTLIVIRDGQPIAAQAGVVGADQLVEALDRIAAAPCPGRCGAEGRGMNDNRRWPLERVLFALAGTITLASAALAATVSTWFLLLTAFVGANQWLYVLVGACPASLVLRRAFHLRSVIYDNDSAAARAQEVTA